MLPPLTDPAGEPTGAVLGMMNMLELMLREQQPRLLAVALDSGRETFRKQSPSVQGHSSSGP